MKTEAGLFGEMPSTKIKSWLIPIPTYLANNIRRRAKSVRSPTTKHDGGGYQTQVLDLDARIHEGPVIEMDYLSLGRMFRNAYTPSGGGWESDMQELMSCCRVFFKRGTR